MKQRIDRLRKLADAVTRGVDGEHEFTMRVPAEPDRDADLVLSWAADEIERLEASVRHWQAQAMLLQRVLEDNGIDYVELAADPAQPEQNDG